MHTQNVKIMHKHENTKEICRTDAHDMHWYAPRFKNFSGTPTESRRGVQHTHLHGNPDPNDEHADDKLSPDSRP